MGRPDVTTLLAENWHNLPHEDGRPRRLMEYSQFGKTDEARKHFRSLAIDIADCVQTLLSRHGYTITHKDDPKPADHPGYKTTHIKCGDCGKQLLQIGVNHDMTATFNRLALRTLTQINPQCPHD